MGPEVLTDEALADLGPGQPSLAAAFVACGGRRFLRAKSRCILGCKGLQREGLHEPGLLLHHDDIQHIVVTIIMLVIATIRLSLFLSEI